MYDVCISEEYFIVSATHAIVMLRIINYNYVMLVFIIIIKIYNNSNKICIVDFKAMSDKY